MPSITLEKISSLKQLIDCLSSGHYNKVLEEVAGMEISVADLSPYLFWNKEHYTRNCIARNDQFELLALCWEEGQKTPIHSHNEQECWVKVIQGGFIENTYDAECNLDAVSSHELQKHDATTMDDEELFHSLENSHEGRSISLHLYKEPIDECQFLCPDDNVLKVVNLSDYSFAGEKC